MYYHATRKRSLENIKRHGLLTSKSKSNTKGVYLSDCGFSASNYSCQDDEKWVLLHIEPQLIDENKLSPDDYELIDAMRSGNEDLVDYSHWSEVPWQTSLQVCNQVSYLGDIPWKAISRVEELN